MFDLIDALGSGMADALQKPAEAGNELEMIRVEIAKWQQRVPKITELLRNRSEALAASELQNRQLRKALSRARETVAQSRGEAEIPVPANGREELEDELLALRFESSRLQKELGSLETRNRMLAETVEVLTHQFSRSHAELLAFRRARDQSPAHVEMQPAGANGTGHAIALLSPTLSELTFPDLLQIRGVGIKTRQRLVDAGINSVESLAKLTAAKRDDPAFSLFSFGPRMRRERWVEQAQQLLDSRATTKKLSGQGIQ